MTFKNNLTKNAKKCGAGSQCAVTYKQNRPHLHHTSTYIFTKYDNPLLLFDVKLSLHLMKFMCVCVCARARMHVRACIIHQSKKLGVIYTSPAVFMIFSH